MLVLFYFYFQAGRAVCREPALSRGCGAPCPAYRGARGAAWAQGLGVPWSPGFVAPVRLHAGVHVGLLGAVGTPGTETSVGSRSAGAPSKVGAGGTGGSAGAAPLQAQCLPPTRGARRSPQPPLGLCDLVAKTSVSAGVLKFPLPKARSAERLIV